MIERLPFHTTLPDHFFDFVANQPERWASGADENRAIVQSLFQLESARNEIILYTDQQTLRLVSIFPEQSTEAYFGFWETPDDLLLNQNAFSLLEADARQRGRTVILGPINFNTFHRYRLRLNDVPSWGQFDREPVNPVYYPTLLDQLGFQIKSRFESRLIRKETIPVVYQGKKLLLADLTSIPYDFIPLNPETWQRYEDELFELVHQVFSANPAYKPISKTQFGLLYNRQFAKKLCPHTSVLFRDQPSGQLVALSFCQPNYQSLTLPAGETPTFERDFPRLDKKVLLVKSVGVHPAFRQQRLMSYLGAYGMIGFRELYDEVIFCLMRADNFSLHFSDGFPFERAQYALFEKEITY